MPHKRYTLQTFFYFPGLQMQNPVLDFLCSSLIPELGADITAGTSCHKHTVLVTVAAVGAFPNQLAGIVGYNFDFTVISATLAVVALCIQFCIHNMVVHIFHYGKDCFNIILQVWYLHIADGATGGQLLEFCLKF